jgi:hypothetical protein
MQTSFNILLIFLTIENFGCDEKFSYSCETFCTRNTLPINFFISPVLLPVPTGLRSLFQKVFFAVLTILFCTVKLPITYDRKLF